MTYTVQAGDTLSAVAQRYRTTVEAILQLNPQITHPDRLAVGQILRLPQATRLVFTASDLCRLAPGLSLTRAESLIDAVTYAMEEADCQTPLRQAMFLAQTAHETAGFRHLKELGKDSYFQRYEGRRDLGNVMPGDGARYKGRGFLMLTGRANYGEASEAIGINILKFPGFAEVPVVAAKVAAWFWESRRLNGPADSGDVPLATRRIQGGTGGLEDRRQYYERAKVILGS